MVGKLPTSNACYPSGSFTPATSSLIPTASAGNPGAGLSPFVLETLSEGEIMNSTARYNLTTLVVSSSGSKDNVRWEIASPNTNNGTFSLLVRRGDDNNNQKVVLEQYNNLSLDPYASNYISKVIGDTSKTPASDGTGPLHPRNWNLPLMPQGMLE